MNRLTLFAALLIACSLTQPILAKDVMTVSGTVKTDDGKPARGVTVVINYYPERSSMSFGMRGRDETSATSDARGRLVFSLPRTAYSLSYRIETPAASRLRLAGFGSSADNFREIGDAGGPVQIDVRMKAGSERLSGKVTDAAGKPVRGAVVTMTWGETGVSTGRGASQSLTATTDARGAYRFEHLLPGDYRIDSVVPPRGTGLVPMPRMWRGHGGVRVPGKAARAKDFALKRGASIRGRVIDEDGRPIAGAEVSATRAPAAIDGPAIFGRAGNFSDTTTTDTRGRYTLEGLTPETYQVTASSPEDADFAPSTPATGLRCEIDKTVDCGDIVLVKGGVLEGHVTGADAKPVVGVKVYYGTDVTETDAGGRYRFERLRTGLGSVRVIPPDGSIWAGRTIEMVPCLAKVRLRRDCTLQKGGSISGVVTAENGEPLEGIRVYTSFVNYRYATTTDTDGRYRLVGLVANHGVDYKKRPRLYGLGVTPPAKSPYMSAGEQFSIKLGEAIGRDVILKLGATIEGKVTDVDGKPVAEARIEVYKNVGRGGRSYYGTAGPGPGRGLLTAADGSFTVRKIPNETVNVSAMPAEGVNLLRAERRGLTCRAGETTTVKLRMAAGGEVAGTVRDARGKPMLGARVTLAQKTGGRRTGWGRRIRPVDTDVRGEFGFVGLPGGAYEIRVNVYDGEHVVAAETVDVQAGERTVAHLRAKRGAFIEVTAMGPDGKPIAKGSARASSGVRGAQSVYGTIQSGRAVVGPLLPGTYTVQVTSYRTKDRTFAPATIAGVTVKEGQRVKRRAALKEGPKPAAPRRPRGGVPRGGLGGSPPGGAG